MSIEELIICDFDGSVSEYVPNPKDAQFHKDFLSFLRNYLAQGKKNKFVFLTGRNPDFIAQKVPVEVRWEIDYIGDYGLSTLDQQHGIVYKDFAVAYLEKCKELFNAISSLFEEQSNIVEQTAFSVIVHLRWVDKETADNIESALSDFFLNSIYREDFALIYGDKTISILPAIDYDKGQAVENIYYEYKSEDLKHVHYVGDDVPDLPAFQKLRKLREIDNLDGINFVVAHPQSKIVELDSFSSQQDKLFYSVKEAIDALGKHLIS